MDWSLGRYEQVAVGLHPAAVAVIEAAAPVAGESVVDIGCGTGNAALLAAERGARVVGIDPAQRLLDVAGAQAASIGSNADFRPGDAATIPLADGGADVAVSVFGVIFAPDASLAAAEMARVLGPRGRFALCAWMPGGPLAELITIRGEAVPAEGGAAPAPPRFAWHDAAALSDLFGPVGFAVQLSQRRLAFTARSAQRFLDTELGAHPAWVAARPQLESRGALAEVRRRALAVLEAANEDPGAFRVTSRYVVVTGAPGHA